MCVSFFQISKMKFPSLPSGPFIHLQGLYFIFHLIEAVVSEQQEEGPPEVGEGCEGGVTFRDQEGHQRHNSPTRPRGRGRLFLALRSRIS